MPPTPTTNPVAEVISHGLVSSAGSTTKNIVNVFHFMRIAGSVNPNMTNLEAAFQTALMIPITNNVNHRFTQVFNTARLMNDVTNPVTQVSRAVVGAIAGDSMPTFNYAYILLRTANRGKNFRGNKKIGPMSESNTTSGTDDIWNAAALTLLGTIATALVTNITDSDGNVWQNVVLSKTLSLTKKNPTTIVCVPITSALINKRVGRMKRREVASAY